MVLGPTARLWLPYLNFTVAISALGFQTAVLYPWHEELDQEFKNLKQEHKEQLHLHQQVTLKQLEDLERRMTVTEKAMPGVRLIPMAWLKGRCYSHNIKGFPMILGFDHSYRCILFVTYLFFSFLKKEQIYLFLFSLSHNPSS
jgi:hypothetical protein